MSRTEPAGENRNRELREPPRNTRITGHFDVLVIGGGPAGVSAAICSARQGAKTALIERFGAVGGMSTVGMMSTWCGKRPRNTFAEEIINRSTVDGWDGQEGEIDHERLQLAYLEMIEEANVHLQLYTLATEPVLDGQTIKGVITESKTGRSAVLADIVIDASGDGDIAARAGVPFVLGRESDNKMQPMTLMFKVGGLDPERSVFFGGPRDYKQVPRGEAQKLAFDELPFPMGFLCVRPAAKHGLATCNITRTLLVDGTNAADLTKAHIECRKQISAVVEFLRKSIPGYEHCFLIGTGAMIGVRETRHFRGEYTLHEDDLLGGKVFDDWAVASANFLMDVHNMTGKGWLDESVRETKQPPSSGYTIPYRSFIPKQIDNLLLAGRNISGTHLAHASYRVMSTCANMGQAVGIAAALCKKHHVTPRKLDAKLVQNVLRTYGIEPDR